jgi:hypothetical protein
VVLNSGASDFGVQDGTTLGSESCGTNFQVIKMNHDNASSVSRCVIFRPGGQLAMPGGQEMRNMIIRLVEGARVPGGDIVLKKDSDGKSVYTCLIINPLTGRSEIRTTDPE